MHLYFVIAYFLKSVYLAPQLVLRALPYLEDCSSGRQTVFSIAEPCGTMIFPGRDTRTFKYRKNQQQKHEYIWRRAQDSWRFLIVSGGLRTCESVLCSISLLLRQKSGESRRGKYFKNRKSVRRCKTPSDSRLYTGVKWHRHKKSRSSLLKTWVL